MWIIAGTIPDPDFSLLVPEGPAPRSASLSEAGLHLPDGRTVPVERGTAALAATALQTCAALGCPNPPVAPLAPFGPWPLGPGMNPVKSPGLDRGYLLPGPWA